MSQPESLAKVKNPLAMVAIFSAISELAMAFVITKLSDKLQEIFIWFVMGFPSVLVFIFFFILYKRPAVFFSPGDYKREELYVSSIGLAQHDDSVETRVRKIEETLSALQDYLEKSKPGANQVEYSQIRKTMERQLEMEANPLYSFITRDLKIEHELAQEVLNEASDARELPTLLEKRNQDKKKISRLVDLITAFPTVLTDFQKFKTLELMK